MRYTFYLVIFLCFFSIKTIAQQSGKEKISISFQNISLKEAMQELETVSEYTFFYDATELDLKQSVSLTTNNEELRLALHRMFEPTMIAFKIQKRQIVLTTKQIEVTKKGASKTIRGTVTDESGEPIIGASILVKGTINGVLTDIDGKYTITAKEGETLEIRYIGYNSVEQTIKGKNIINVILSESNVSLDDVVIIGYGSQKKESVVSSVNSISPANIAMPTRSLANTIAGQVAGVIAIQRSGEPGNDDAQFWIRGQSSYMGGTSPLVLVDGVPRSMNDIDVDEIESFTVLKDAAATAVYGAEGANGVVLITSKRGKAQKTVVNFNAQFSIVTPTRMPKLIDAYNYLSLYNEAEWNDKGNPGDLSNFFGSYSQEIMENYRLGVDPDLYPNVNWMDLLSEHTTNQRYTINFRGGSEKTKFFVSGAYYKEDGIFKSNPTESYNANIGLQRFNLRSNVDMDITSTTQLSVDLSGQYKTKNQPGNNSSTLFSALTRFPIHLVPMYYSDGSLSDPIGAASGRYNPYNLLNHSGYIKSWDASLQSKVALNQKLDFITKGLSVRASLSFDADFTSTTKRTKTPQTVFATGRDDLGNLITQTIQNPSALSDPTYSASGGTKKIHIETSLNYKRMFAQKHDVGAIVVYNQKETQHQNVAGLQLLPYRKQNFVGRASYGYDSRYMIEGSFGMTGSENFASGHRWGFFPAVGAAWYISNEKFIRETKAKHIISKLKLRASYGVTGNDNIGASNRFPYREKLDAAGKDYQFNMNIGASGGVSDPGSTGIIESTFAAPALTWELEKKLNIGVDIGLFNNQIDITADYFSNRRDHILIQRKTVPATTGFRVNPWQNFGIVDNKGFDASITLNHKIGDVKVSARGNITYAKNTVVEYDEAPQAEDYMYFTGQSIGQPFCYIADGLYTPDDFNIIQDNNGANIYTLKDGLPKPAANVSPGDIKYRDLNNDGVIDKMDQTYKNGLNSANPEIVYGFGLNLEYKGFFAGIFFQGVGKATTNLLSSVANIMPFYSGVDSSSARIEALDRWTASDPYNQNVMFPRMHATKYDHNNQKSTWWYRNASFLRLKNVEFGYNFDKQMLQKLRMSNIKLFVQGTNLAVWDNIKLWDPELGNSTSGSTYPICGTWTSGLEVTF